MALPQLKTDDSSLRDLIWTRLKPAAEVDHGTPTPPPPQRRPGLTLGPEKVEMVGEGFDRRAVVAAVIEDDDGVHVIGGKEIKARQLTGQTLRYEPNRAWSPADMAAIEPEALAILKAHDFPVHLEWPAGAWAWDDGDLFWSDVPAHAVLVLNGREDLGMSGVERGGLGWPVPPHPDDAARSSRLWPRFSPFGWAIEVFDMLRYRRSALATLQRLTLEAMHRVAERSANGVHYAVETGSGEPGSPLFDVDRMAGFLSEEFDHAWRLGFELGGYLSEHRVRQLHGDMLDRGQKNHRAVVSGAERGNAAKQAAVSARRAIVQREAPEFLSKSVYPNGYKRWSAPALAQALRDSWPDEGCEPAVSLLQSDIAALGGVLALAQAR